MESDILTQLEDTNQQIEELKVEKARIEGKKEQLTSDMQKAFEVSTVDDAEALFEKLTEEDASLEREATELNNKLQLIVDRNS